MGGEVNRGSLRGQAYVEFAMVLLIIITLLVGGILVIRALFLEENLNDIATRAAQWGASTNNNDQVMQIINEAHSFATDLQVTLNPPDAAHRPIGTVFTVTLKANVPMVGPGLALIVPLGAQASALIEHTPMSFSQPLLTNTLLRIGDTVLVHTTAGDTLTVRHNPGLDGTRAFYMHDKDHAIIVGGPTLANGLRWWQIIYGRAKLTGWCVDQADTVTTLIPYF
ncbi:MAG: TadE/TadG family type IV pilus assembly protein [Aggregatilineales bacterium]